MGTFGRWSAVQGIIDAAASEEGTAVVGAESEDGEEGWIDAPHCNVTVQAPPALLLLPPQALAASVIFVIGPSRGRGGVRRAACRRRVAPLPVAVRLLGICSPTARCRHTRLSGTFTASGAACGRPAPPALLRSPGHPPWSFLPHRPWRGRHPGGRLGEAEAAVLDAGPVLRSFGRGLPLAVRGELGSDRHDSTVHESSAQQMSCAGPGSGPDSGLGAQ
jgi:hypothetical protein